MISFDDQWALYNMLGTTKMTIYKLTSSSQSLETRHRTWKHLEKLPKLR